ncbi:MAG TPA: sigma factor, partial [Draconibacterium sp.]|nr:sigma factor [Draconibacterium sp.]
MSEANDKILFEKINKNDVKAFETLFHRYYKSLCLYAAKIIKNDSAAEEIVQDLFVKLWEKRNTLEIKISVKNYLVRSVKNQCL